MHLKRLYTSLKVSARLILVSNCYVTQLGLEKKNKITPSTNKQELTDDISEEISSII